MTARRPISAEAVIFGGLLLLVVLAKAPLLGTPYYWDETLWIGFAHKLSASELWRVLPGFHEPFRYGNRPPGLFLPMAAAFQLTGFSIALSHLYILAFAFVGVWFTYRLASHWYGRLAGFLAALFLFLNATYFAQSTMFLADLPVAALGATTLYFGVRRRFPLYWVSALLLLSLKEPAMAIVCALAGWSFLVRVHSCRTSALADGLRYVAPLVPIALFYLWQWRVTGYAFAHYAYAFEPIVWDLDTARAKLPRVHRWLLVEQGRWVFSLLIVAAVARPAFRRRSELLLLALLLVAAGYAYIFLYFLPRYLLPVAPLFAVVSAGAVAALARRPGPRLAAGLLLVGILLGNLEARPRWGNGEMDMSYLAVVRMHEEASAFLAAEHAERPILTGFPFGAILTMPQLGYVRAPLRAVFHGPGPVRIPQPGGLIVVGEPGDTDALERHARHRGLRLLRRFADGDSHVSLYAAEPEPGR